MNNSRFCYIDCTDTFSSGLHTGIQRVVKNIIIRAKQYNGLEGFSFIPVIAVGSKMLPLNPDFGRQYTCFRFANRVLGSVRNMLDLVFSVNKVTPVTVYKSDNNVTITNSITHRIHSSIIDSCRRLIPLLLRLPLYFDIFSSRCQTVTVKKGDILFLADSFLNVHSLQAARLVKSKGVNIYLLLYDIIPVTHPQFFDKVHNSLFQANFPQVLNLIDGVICISKYSMKEVEHYCRSIGNAAINFDYFNLGADFHLLESQKKTDALFEWNLHDGDYFLMVGTIEPRKNHLYVLDAFERLWRQGYITKLCIVGKIGWKCHDIVSRIKGSKYFGKFLYMYNNVNDEDLAYYFSNARAIIIASIIEGFGLPLIEAMHYGKIVLASDIPVFREVGGDYPHYFPLDNPESLVDKISLVSCGFLVTGTVSKNWLTWDQSIEMLFNKLVAMADVRSETITVNGVTGMNR